MTAPRSLAREEVAGCELAPLRRIRGWLVFFAVALAASGATAFFLPWETRVLVKSLWGDALPGTSWAPGLHAWLVVCRDALAETEARHPFLLYGTDWLGFAHLMFAVLFLDAARDPARSTGVVRFGLICCAGVVVHAAIFVPLRGIPVYWIAVDGAFGVFGAVPLWLILRDLRRLATAESR